MTQRSIAATLVCTVAVAVGLSAATDQSAGVHETRPAAQPADEAAGRVIRALPPVSFGRATAPDQPPLGTPNLDRYRVPLVQHDGKARTPASTRTVCGLTMIEPSPDLDAKMRLPADRSTGAAVRRIEPKICTGDAAR